MILETVPVTFREHRPLNWQSATNRASHDYAEALTFGRRRVCARVVNPFNKLISALAHQSRSG